MFEDALSMIGTVTIVAIGLSIGVIYKQYTTLTVVDVNNACSIIKKEEQLKSKRLEYYNSCMSEYTEKDFNATVWCSDRAESAYPSMYTFVNDKGRNMDAFKVAIAKGCEN